MPSIRWVADAVMILHSSPREIDWDRLVRQAHERPLILPLRETLTYLHKVFDAPILSAVLYKLHSKSTSRMERFEFRYKASGYQNKPCGYLPIL